MTLKITKDDETYSFPCFTFVREIFHFQNQYRCCSTWTNALLETINDYSIHDSTDDRDLAVRDIEGELIVAKLSRPKAQCLYGNKKWWQESKHKPSMEHGEKCWDLFTLQMFWILERSFEIRSLGSLCLQTTNTIWNQEKNWLWSF
jgi:hypothetical protein